MDRKFVLSKDDIPVTAALVSPNEAACEAVFSSWFPGEDFTPENLKKVPMRAIREAMTSVVVDEIDFFLREVYAIIKFPVGETWEDLPQPGKEILKVLCRHIRYLMSKLAISKSEVKKQLVETLRAYTSDEVISEVIDFFLKKGLSGFPIKIFLDMRLNADKSRPKPIRPVPEEFVEPDLTSLWKASDFRVTADAVRATGESIEELTELIRKEISKDS